MHVGRSRSIARLSGFCPHDFVSARALKPICLFSLQTAKPRILSGVFFHLCSCLSDRSAGNIHSNPRLCWFSLQTAKPQILSGVFFLLAGPKSSRLKTNPKQHPTDRAALWQNMPIIDDSPKRKTRGQSGIFFYP